MNRKQLAVSLALALIGSAAVAAPAKAPAVTNQVIMPSQQIQVPVGADPALVATQAWAKTGRGQIIMDDDKPLYPYGLMTPALTCSPGYVCSVNLQPGETPLSVTIGNPGLWQVEMLQSSGNRYTAAFRVLEFNADTNALITTDKRVYNLKLHADRGAYVPVIGFYYPKEQMASWVNQAQAQQVEQVAQAKAQARNDDLPSLTASDLNYRYYMEGRDYSWKPMRVYDDGKKTWIEMNPQMQVSAAPALVLISKDGKEEAVNYRVITGGEGKSSFFVVDRLFDHAALLNGVGRGAERVDIYKGDKPKKLFDRF